MKPGDLYLGVLHFFSILLPGSVLVMLILWSGQLDALITEIALTKDVERWAGFLLASYGLGHVTFLIASSLDWLVYDSLRKIVWPDKPGSPYNQATALRDAELAQHLPDTTSMNTFTWAKASLLRAWPEASAEVQRFEADSKFFRSLCVVAVFAAVQFWLHDRDGLGYAALLIGLLSLMRYAEQRQKSTRFAYQYVLILHMQGPPSSKATS